MPGRSGSRGTDIGEPAVGEVDPGEPATGDEDLSEVGTGGVAFARSHPFSRLGDPQVLEP